MAKKKEKKIPITVTARFEVTFTHYVTEDEFKQLDAEEVGIEDVVDDSVPYDLLATDGNSEMEWDYAVIPTKKKKK